MGALTNTQRRLLASLAARVVPASGFLAGANRVAERVRREWSQLRANAS